MNFSSEDLTATYLAIDILVDEYLKDKSDEKARLIIEEIKVLTENLRGENLLQILEFLHKAQLNYKEAPEIWDKLQKICVTQREKLENEIFKHLVI